MLTDDFEEDTIRYAGDAETLASFGVTTNADIPQFYIDWMASLPYYFELEDYILVHAGLNFNTDSPFEDKLNLIWIRDWHREIDRDWLGERIVLHGHTPTAILEIYKSVKQLDDIPAIGLDGGCVFDRVGFGQLVAFNLDTKELTCEPNADIITKFSSNTITLPNEDHPLSLKIEKSPTTKVLYFDIDGTILDYDDQPKQALINGHLENALKKADFDYLACVSGWVDIFYDPVMKLDTLEKKKEALYQLLEPLFPDKVWFFEKIILITDTDHRCKYMDLNIDWFYVDDWADEFMTKVHGADSFQKEKDRRILLCDHRGNGRDIIAWLEREIIS